MIDVNFNDLIYIESGDRFYLDCVSQLRSCLVIENNKRRIKLLLQDGLFIKLYNQDIINDNPLVYYKVSKIYFLYFFTGDDVKDCKCKLFSDKDITKVLREFSARKLLVARLWYTIKHFNPDGWGNASINRLAAYSGITRERILSFLEEHNTSDRDLLGMLHGLDHINSLGCFNDYCVAGGFSR